MNRETVRSCLALGAAILLAIPIKNTIEAPYLLSAITNRADCSGNIAANDPNYPFDAIVVPGGRIEAPIRLEAASFALSKGLAPRIIFLGEAGDNTINTATEMKKLAEIAATHNIGRVVMVTNDYHELRATLLACTNGIPASSLSAEDLLAEKDQNRETIVRPKRYTPLEEFIIEMKERIGTILLLWDTKGVIPTFIRKTEFQ